MTILHHPFDTPPAAAAVTEVAPGVLWLRMPLPLALDHVNVWALDDGDGWALVDTGMADDTTRGLWETLLAGPLAGRPVTRLVATHFHPDHMGLAGWLSQRCGVKLTATLGEWTMARMLWLEVGEDFVANQVGHYRRLGFGDEILAEAGLLANGYRPRVGAPPACIHRMAEGDELTIGGRIWRVGTHGGHSPEHACLWCAEDGLLIAGDQILPKISPVVGVRPYEPAADPLTLFLAGLRRLATLPTETLVLPSHGLPFHGLQARCDHLAHHHHQRLERTLAACAEPATGFEVQTRLFRRLADARQIRFAVDETLAHLNHLTATGTLGQESRDDGVWLWRHRP